MNREEELRLIACAQAGDAQAQEALLRAHLPLIRALARRFFTSPALEDELMQAGSIGLMQAVMRHRGEAGARLTTYAMPWILGEMKRALRQALDATGAYARRQQLERCEEALRTSLGRSPRVEELARASGIPAQEMARIWACSAPALSMEADGAGEDGRSLEEALGEEAIDLARLDLHIALDALSDEERTLVLLRFFRDRTQREAAGLLGKSQAQICRIERRALDHLRALLA